jgi:hypothetical protein
MFGMVWHGHGLGCPWTSPAMCWAGLTWPRSELTKVWAGYGPGLTWAGLAMG